MNRIINVLFSVAVFVTSVWAQYDTAYVPIRVTNVDAKVKIVPVGNAVGFFGDSANVNARTRGYDTLKLLAPTSYASVLHGETRRVTNNQALVNHSRGMVVLELHPQTFQNARVSLFSVSGKQVMCGKVSASKAVNSNISHRNIAQGVYMLHISGARDSFTHRFVHDGGKLDIRITFDGRDRLMKQAATQEIGDVKWRLTASATDYVDTSYEITPQKGTNNQAQSITLRERQITPSGLSALEYFKQENIRMGWNLGNTLDAYNRSKIAQEGAWSAPAATQTLINAVAARGVDIVRIPCTWMGHIGSTPNYTITPDRLARVKVVVDWVLAAGMKAMINIHHDGEYPQGSTTTTGFLKFAEVVRNDRNEDNEQIKDQLYKLWEQIADYFKDYDERLMFETLNEIHDGDWGIGTGDAFWAKEKLLQTWNQTALDAIRSTGGKNLTRYVGIPGMGSQEATQLVGADGRGNLLPNDIAGNGTKYLIVSSHYYKPHGFTHGDGTISESDFKWNDEAAKKLYDHFIVGKKMAVYYGEWGAITNGRSSGNQNTHIDYIRSVATAVTKYGIVPIIWDDGGDFKILERSGTYVGNTEPGTFRNNVWNAYYDAVNGR